MSGNSDWRKFREALEDYGCTMVPVKQGGHVKVFYGSTLITSLLGSPGDNRALINTIAEARRRLPDDFDYRLKTPRKKRNDDEEEDE